MSMPSAVSAATIQAYRTTHFVVKGSNPFVLRVGVKSTPLLSLYGETLSDCCAYLTAYNPYSELLSDSANAERQARLERDLETQGWKFFPGSGEHSSGDWPGEPSFLVLGMSRDEAKAFGARYEQNAIVWCGVARMRCQSSFSSDSVIRPRRNGSDVRSIEMISTIEERDRAKQRLEQRSSEALAQFILTLIHAPHGVGAYVEAFIAADEPERSVGIIEAQISALRRGETDYEWRHRRGDDFTAQSELVLDAIEHVVLPRDAVGGLRLLERFYECEREIVDGSFGDDLGLSGLFERAARLFHAAAGGLATAEVDALRERLLAHDDYGLRRQLRKVSV